MRPWRATSRSRHPTRRTDAGPPMADTLYPDAGTRTVLESGCARCPDLAEAREHIAWGNGSRDADVMVVGEAPGAGTPDADRWRGGNWTGLAYTARHSGRLVRRLFAEIGYGSDDLYVTNAVKCFPAARDDPTTNREPTPAERQACWTHLEAELQQVEPSVVVATGRHATAGLLAAEGRSLDGFLQVVLEPQPCPTFGVTVLPILHPSYEAVWRARLGYASREAYVAAVGEALADEL